MVISAHSRACIATGSSSASASSRCRLYEYICSLMKVLFRLSSIQVSLKSHTHFLRAVPLQSPAHQGSSLSQRRHAVMSLAGRCLEKLGCRMFRSNRVRSILCIRMYRTPTSSDCLAVIAKLLKLCIVIGIFDLHPSRRVLSKVHSLPVNISQSPTWVSFSRRSPTCLSLKAF